MSETVLVLLCELWREMKRRRRSKVELGETGRMSKHRCHRSPTMSSFDSFDESRVDMKRNENKGDCFEVGADVQKHN